MIDKVGDIKYFTVFVTIHKKRDLGSRRNIFDGSNIGYSILFSTKEPSAESFSP